MRLGKKGGDGDQVTDPSEHHDKSGAKSIGNKTKGPLNYINDLSVM